MKIRIEIDSSLTEPEAVIRTRSVTDEVRDAVSRLESRTICAYSDGSAVMLNTADIVRIYSQSGKVCIQTEHGLYNIGKRVYELEALLKGDGFLRISHSEIVNIRKIKRLDLSLSGTVLISLEGDIRAYSSRRYVSVIKSALGVKSE